MIPAPYIRSSSMGNWKFCQMQYFLTYALGKQRDAGKKALLGTIVHKVMEILAIAKLEHQKTLETSITIKDEAVGIYNIDINTWLKPYTLTLKEIESINKTRTNKYVYKTNASIQEGHTRYGVELIQELTDLAYIYYTSKNNHYEYVPMDKKNVVNWVWMALDYKNGICDPRKREIFAPEHGFSLTIDKDWAIFDYEIQGVQSTGNLAIKGTIDLITKVDTDVYEIIDYKTGQRKDWNTGEEKTYKYLCSDKQLMLYYYAAKQLIPNAKAVILTILFIRDGGPFSICFEPEHLIEFEDYLKKIYKEISTCEVPQMCDTTQTCDKCVFYCDFYKQQTNGMNTCRFIHEMIKKHGIQHVIDSYKEPGFDLNYYEAPGE